MHTIQQPRIAVYTGEGASHSWTWFADIFEREHISAAAFVDEADMLSGALDSADVLFVSGGDTFAIAAALGEPGARAIERFIRGGGTYIGACAGAYLLLKSSLEPLHYFNFVEAKITNLTRCLPPALQRPEKYCTAYGCRYIYHPVRGEVVMRYGSGSHAARSVHAPLYGGSAMHACDDIETLATYADFTGETEFLVEEQIAHDTLIGHVAAACKRFGRGVIYLFGPHFEHPDYPEANRIIFDCIAGARTDALQGIAAAADASRATGEALRRMLSELSNARITALALERSSYQWLIGAKVYDPEKIRVFLEAVWKRARVFQKQGLIGSCSADLIDQLSASFARISVHLRALRRDAQCGCAAEMFRELRCAAASFMNMYFNALRSHENTVESAAQCIRDAAPLESIAAFRDNRVEVNY
jgi:glutamine amidotransferase-like uncharacterized protein